MKKKKRKTLKSKIRIFSAIIVFGAITMALGNNCLNNIKEIQNMKKVKKSLQNEVVSLKENNEILKTDVLRFEDPDYLAKYIREKYFYSKEGELKLRLDK